MTTTFKAALGICGLSQREAADFIGVSEGTIKDWCTGRRGQHPPSGAWEMLASLHNQIVIASEAALDVVEIDGADRSALNLFEIETGNKPFATEGVAASAAAMVVLARMLDKVEYDA